MTAKCNKTKTGFKCLDLFDIETDNYKCLIHLAVKYGRLQLLDLWWKEETNPNQSVSAALSTDPDFSPSSTLATALLQFQAAVGNEEKGKIYINAYL